jgi:hypothetical protein
MAELDTLNSIIAACEANILAAVNGSVPGIPGSLPNASGGGQVDHGEYIQRQRDTIAWAKAQIASAAGPWEVQVKGQT